MGKTEKSEKMGGGGMTTTGRSRARASASLLSVQAQVLQNRGSEAKGAEAKGAAGGKEN